eukprot:2008462-Amphidinium_carterae.1
MSAYMAPTDTNPWDLRSCCLVELIPFAGGVDPIRFFCVVDCCAALVTLGLRGFDGKVQSPKRARNG